MGEELNEEIAQIKGAEAWHQGCRIDENPLKGALFERDWEDGWRDANEECHAS